MNSYYINSFKKRKSKNEEEIWIETEQKKKKISLI